MVSRILDVGLEKKLNFSTGIVTSYVVRTHPLGKIWGGFRAYTPDQLPNVLSALAEYQATVDDADSSLILNIPLNNLTTSGFILNMVYLRPVVEPAAFKLFLDIPYAVDTTKIQNYDELLGSTPLPDLPRYIKLLCGWTRLTVV